MTPSYRVTVTPKSISLEDLTRYEEGLLDEEEIEDLFQRLVDTGLAWRLQGSYGRMAYALINAGRIHPPAFS